MKNRAAFTMVELVFVIVVLGILAAVAVPKLAASRTDAQIAKGRADIATVRSGIITERQQRLFRGQSNYINRLDAGAAIAANTEGVLIFDNNGTAANQIIMTGVRTKDTDGNWMKRGNNQYSFKLERVNVLFTYTPTNGTLECNRTNATYGKQCQMLTE